MKLMDLLKEADDQVPPGQPPAAPDMSKLGSAIDPSTPYGVVDKQTGQVVYRTTYANRKRARGVADRKDNEYGGYRYFAGILKPGQ